MTLNIHNVNGLLFWNQEQIQFRNHAVEQIAANIQRTLWRENQAWQFEQIEGTTLVPLSIISDEYTSNDVYKQHCIGPGAPALVLRPETTPSTYAYAQHMFNTQTPYKPPVCFWQLGKSFRREQEQPTKFMRLKEFYQLEFQCIYTSDTMNDYRTPVLEKLSNLLAILCNTQTRIIPSDRIPAYSESTLDIEAWDVVAERWMEICSCSIRKDFPQPFTFSTKKGKVEKELKVLEIAIGADRLAYQRFNNDG